MSLRVIGAGVGRTGTTSLKAALERLLGAPAYHMTDLLEHGEHLPLWEDALDGRAPDWEQIFGSFAATVDWPGAAFWDPLHRAYPDALVLLSVRGSAEEWFKSADATINRLMQTPPFPDARRWHTLNLKLLATTFTPIPWDGPTAQACYERHNAEVRAAVPADRLLEWKPGDGWEPICERLGVPVPDEPFPHANTGEEFRTFLDSIPASPPPKRRLFGRRR